MDKRIVAQQAKKLFSSYGLINFIIVFTGPSNWFSDLVSGP